MGESNDAAHDQLEHAYQAIREGRWADAINLLIALSASSPENASIWMGLAISYLKQGDHPEALTAVDRAIALQPRHFPVILMKADILQAMGDHANAVSFYQAALAAAPPEQNQSDRIKSELARARLACADASRKYEKLVRKRLAENGFLTEDDQSRYDETVDLLFGKRRIYLQQPQYLYFPGLEQRQFYDRADFDWVPALEAETQAIAGEARAILDDDRAFQPYLHAQGVMQTNESPLLENVDWSACYLIEKGRIVEENAARCPATMKSLQSVPLCQVDGKMPSVLFSLLRPRTRIEPHTGLFNTRLICHLPLIIPPGCRLRVGNETRTWNPGELVIFDDSIEHEAANDSEQPRVVLLFDIWRPDLSERDRQFVRALFRVIDENTRGSVSIPHQSSSIS